MEKALIRGVNDMIGFYIILACFNELEFMWFFMLSN